MVGKKRPRSNLISAKVQPTDPVGNLLASDSILNSLAESTISMIFIVQDDRFCYVNAAAEDISGYSREELLSMRFLDLIHPDNREEIRNRDTARLRGDPITRNIEIKLLTKSSVECWVDLITNLTSIDGRPAIVGAAFDISARRRKEADLIRRTDEILILHELSADISASHDIKSVMVVIVKRAAALLTSNYGVLYICEQAQKILKVAVSYNLPGIETGAILQYGEGVPGEVAVTEQPVLVEDDGILQRETRGFEAKQAITALIAVPMLWQDRVIGVLEILGTGRVFNASDLNLIKLFAAQASAALENARLLDAERRRRQEAETLAKATAVMTSSLNLEQVLDLILTHLDAVVPYDSACVFLHQGVQLKIVAFKGLSQGEFAIGLEFSSEDALFCEIRDRKSSVIIQDARMDPRFNRWVGTEYVRGWMGVPLIVRNDVIGYVTLDNRRAGAYSMESAHLAEAFVNQAASAIQNARLFEAERSQLLLAQTLQAVGTLLSSELSLDEVLERILDLLGQVVEYDSVSIQLIGASGNLELAAGRGFPEKNRARQIVEEMSAKILATRWRELKVMVIPDVLVDERWVPHKNASYVRSWVGAPLLVKGRFIGSLNVDSRKPNAYDATTGETVMAFANQAAIAIENTRLFEAEHIARERAEALRDAARIISSSLSLHDVFQAVLDQLSRVLQFDTGNVMLVEGKELVIKAWRGYEAFLNPADIQAIRFDMDEDFSVADIVHTRQPVTLANAQKDPRWKTVPTSQHINSWLGVPINIRDQCIGIVNLDRISSLGFSEDEIAIVQTFALHVSTAVENASLFEAEGRTRSRVGGGSPGQPEPDRQP